MTEAPDVPFKAEPLSPFGLALCASGGLESIDPAMLDALVRREKLVLLRGLKASNRDEFLAWCESFPNREVLRWDFGPVMEMHERPNAQNYLFSSEAVPFHWDGAFHRVPTYLMFCCVEAPARDAGGETLFCDTQRVWENASSDERALWSSIRLSYETKKLSHYGGRIEGPLVQRHPSISRPILRFAEPVETALNPVSLEIMGIPEADKACFLARLRSLIYDRANCYVHEWRQDDILVADNHALIHGRRAFNAGGPRHLRRIQLL